MAQWVKALGAKSDGPSLIPGSLMEEGENQLHTEAMTCSPYPDIINKCKANILSRTFLLILLLIVSLCMQDGTVFLFLLPISPAT